MIQDSHSQNNSKKLAKITLWRCPNCGQILFNASALLLPAKCDICHESIEWEVPGNHPQRWRCPNCGQTLFTAPNDKPPDMCNYCSDFTTWTRVYD